MRKRPRPPARQQPIDAVATRRAQRSAHNGDRPALHEEERHHVKQQQHLQRAHPEQHVGIGADDT